MKRVLTIAFVLMLALSTAASAEKYGWTVSESNTNALDNMGTPTGGVATLYLWYQCSTNDGMSAAEFDLQATGITVLAATPQNGFLNAGGPTNLLVAVGGCPPGPMVAVDLLVLYTAGEICLVPSATNGLNVTVNCEGTPVPFVNDSVGFSSNGNPPVCTDALCVPDPVVGRTWSEIKGFYR